MASPTITPWTCASCDAEVAEETRLCEWCAERPPGPLAIYLAARYSRINEMRGTRRLLEAAGYRVTARWVLGLHDTEAGVSDEDAALEDLVDVELADVVVSFTESADVRGRARGGRHVEFGWGLSRGKRVIVVGPRENVFHHHPRVEVVQHLGELLEVLARRRWPAELKTIASLDLPIVDEATADMCLSCGKQTTLCQHGRRSMEVQ